MDIRDPRNVHLCPLLVGVLFQTECKNEVSDEAQRAAEEDQVEHGGGVPRCKRGDRDRKRERLRDGIRGRHGGNARVAGKGEKARGFPLRRPRMTRVLALRYDCLSVFCSEPKKNSEKGFSGLSSSMPGRIGLTMAICSS